MSTIKVGSVTEIYDASDDLAIYVGVDVQVADETCLVACLVGVEDYNQGQVRQNKLDPKPYRSVWFADSSDAQNVPAGLYDDVKEALVESRERLWDEAAALAKV